MTITHVPGRLAAVLAVFCAGAAAVHAQGSTAREADEEALRFFEGRIRPVLVKHCYECHSATAKTVQGGLRLDTRARFLKGGDSGPPIVPGKPDESLLLEALRYESFEMPPTGKLPDAVIADFERWIRLGAPDPREQPAGTPVEGPAGGPGGAAIDFEAARRHWAYQPIARPVPPDVRNAAWAAAPVDRFVLARIEAAGLSTSPAADRRTLVRRVYFDLIGLPPTFEEVAAFVSDSEPDAFVKLIDRLLASVHYGERWGRHWLDVARYADTKDLVLLYGKDAIRPDAYTYRDYVIRAFNADVPYDRFIHEQLAADRLYAARSDRLQPVPAETEAESDRLKPVTPNGAMTNLPDGERWRLAAMGFLTLGRMFDKNPHDIYDDQIDTVTRGLLGLTVSCARCHDHKYDAIPTEDYYSLYGVFASSEPPLERPLIADPPETSEQAEFRKKVETERQKLADLIDREHASILDEACKRTGDYLAKIATEQPDPLEDAVFYLSLSPGDLKPQITSRWRRFLEKRATGDDPVFGPWRELLAVLGDAGAAEPRSHPDAERWKAEDATSAGAEVVERWLQRPAGTGPGELNALVREALAAARPVTRGDVARMYGDLFRRVYEASRPANPGTTASGATDTAAEPAGDAADPARRQLLEILTEADGPVYFPKRSTYLYMTRVPRTEYGQLLLELDKLAVYFEQAPPRAMVLVDSPEPYDPRVFVRGSPSQPGERVPRRFLRILAGEDREPFAEGSGRLELARAITAHDNPLSARVMANRLWMHHFGEPLVDTPSDFGVRSTPPSHPDLLDWLAAELAGRVEGRESRVESQTSEDGVPSTEYGPGATDHGPRTTDDSRPQPSTLNPQPFAWSIKRLHRRILLSAAYQQSSFDRPECRRVDPENRLLWRFRRGRLELEAMRDSLLAVSGRLDRRMYGRPVDVAGDPHNGRRTVYGLVDRQNLPGLYRSFDFASPDQSTARRPDTIVPQQALFAMNSPFLIEQARALATRPEVAASAADRERIAALYRAILGRAPTDEELDSAASFISAQGEDFESAVSRLSRWEQLAQVLLLTNEFMFVD